MKPWVARFFSSETGKPSRSGTIGVLLAVVYAACFVYVVVSGDAKVLGAFKEASSTVATLIGSLLVASKGADAYVATKGAMAKTTTATEAEKTKASPDSKVAPND